MNINGSDVDGGHVLNCSTTNSSKDDAQHHQYLHQNNNNVYMEANHESFGHSTRILLQDASSRQLCKSVDSDFEKLNLHHRAPSFSDCSRMDYVEIKTEPPDAREVSVKLRLKKQRTESNGGYEDPNAERPMSWEGESSDVRIVGKSSTLVNGHCTNGYSVEDRDRLCDQNDPGSPMAVVVGEGPDRGVANLQRNVPSDLSMHSSVINQNGGCSSNNGYKQQQTTRSSPSPIGIRRPTSSSSSSYSLSPSPQHGRPTHPPAMSPSQFSLANSPINTRYTTSSDGSIYSPTQSPNQSRHMFSDRPPSVFSPHQSPIQPRHKSDPFCSPSQSPQSGRTSNSSSVHPYQNLNSHYSFQHPAMNGIPHSAMTAMFSFCYPPSEHSGSESKDTSTGSSPQMSPILQSRTSDVKSSNASDIDPTIPVSERAGSSGSRHSLNSIGSQDPAELSPNIQTSGISRQQLINSPCPICGDKISGFHYGIFSCESCKGFFKRTVQNKKNYVCLRGANCPVTITTRKKCPACRFEKCLRKGMKLEAIREDRTRGGRSTYQCTYATPPAQTNASEYRCSSNYGTSATPSETSSLGSSISGISERLLSNGHSNGASPTNLSISQSVPPSVSGSPVEIPVPPLINEILAVEHLWHYNSSESNHKSSGEQSYGSNSFPAKMMADFTSDANDSQFFANLCNIADYRLYKIVKWCKSLPLFKEIIMDDQISLLINAWCELLVLSCCFRSIGTPNEIRISQGKSVTLQQAQVLGLGTVIERMLNITDHFRRLKFDECEYVCLKVIILLTSDVTVLKEPHKVQHCQEQVLHALQTYSSSHYPQIPSKFGETLLRIPDLERTCQIGKETLFKHRSEDAPSFNLLMELLRGEH